MLDSAAVAEHCEHLLLVPGTFSKHFITALPPVKALLILPTVGVLEEREKETEGERGNMLSAAA